MLIAWFIAVATLSIPSIYFLRERVKPRVTNTSELGTLGFLITPIFAILQAGNIFQALGNFLPGIHLPSVWSITVRLSQPANTWLSIRSTVRGFIAGCGRHAIAIQCSNSNRRHLHGVSSRPVSRFGDALSPISRCCRRGILCVGFRGRLRSSVRLRVLLRHLRRRLELDVGRDKS